MGAGHIRSGSVDIQPIHTPCVTGKLRKGKREPAQSRLQSALKAGTQWEFDDSGELATHQEKNDTLESNHEDFVVREVEKNTLLEQIIDNVTITGPTLV
jgi:hypothetical protein